MSYRGQNNIANSTQVWDGAKWVPLNGLLFTDVFSAAASTEWKGPNGEFGYTGDGGLIEGQSEVLDNQSTATTARSVKRKLRVFLDAAGGEDPTVDYDLPIAVYGVSPTETVSSRDQNQLVAEVSVGVNRIDGSSWTFQKWLVAWRWDSDAAGFSATAFVNQLSTPGGLTTLAASGVGGPPAVPRLTIGQSGTSDAARYFIEIDLTLIVMDGTP